MPLDYTSTPLPANGQARSAAALAATFNNIKTQYNGHTDNVTLLDRHNASSITASDQATHPLTTVRANTGSNAWTEFDMMRRMWLELVDGDFTPANFATKAVPITLATVAPFITGATSAATARAVFLRDSLGGGSLSSLSLALVSGSTFGLNIQGFKPLGDALGVNYELIRDSALVTVRSLDKSGNEIVAGSVTAGGGFVGNASSATRLAGFGPSVTGVDNSVTFAAGSYINSNGTQIDVAQTTINFASFNAVNYVPTTGNQWIAVSLDVNGTYVLTPGTVNGAKTTAIVPTNTYPVLWVLLRQNNTQIKLTDDSVAGHGFLAAPPVGSAFASGGATALTPIYQEYTQPDLRSRLMIASGNKTVTLQAGSSAIGSTLQTTPFLAAVQGKSFQFTANVTTARGADVVLGSGASGTVALVLDVNAGTIFFALPGASLSTYQTVIANYYYAASVPALVAFNDPTPVQSVTGSQLIPQTNPVSVSNSSATNHTGWAPGATPIADTNMALNAFNIPVPMTVHITGFAHIKTHLTAAGDAVNMIVQANGGYASAPWVEAVSGGATYPYIHEQVVPIEAWIDLPSPGYWQIGQYWSTTGGATVDLFDRAVVVEFFATRQTI